MTTTICIDNFYVNKFQEKGVTIGSLNRFVKKNSEININQLSKISLGNRVLDNKLLGCLSKLLITYDDLTELTTEELKYKINDYSNCE
jgi:hypothetical protein